MGEADQDDLVEIDSDGALINQEDEKKKKRKKKLGPNDPPSDLLLNERVNAKLLQYKLKRLGIAVSLWEIFSLFEFVNLRLAKMAYEPQRYHYVMFEHLYTTMTASDYKTDMLGMSVPQETDKKKKSKSPTKKKVEDEEALAVAKDLNDDDKPVKPEEEPESSVVSSSVQDSSSSDSDSDISGDSLCDSEREHRRLKKRDAKLAKLTYH